MANTFYGIARNSVTLILNSPKNRQVAVAKACFPGITQEHIDILLNTPHKITFTVDGNEVIFPDNDQQKGAFTVLAGKYDGHERNCKYCEDFATLDEAISAYDKVKDYPWAEIQYKGRTFQIHN